MIKFIYPDATAEKFGDTWRQSGEVCDTMQYAIMSTFVMCNLCPVRGVMDMYREVTFSRTGIVQGLDPNIQPSNNVKTVSRCVSASLASGATEFSVRPNGGKKYQCILSTNPADLPVGNWTTYSTGIPLGREQ